MLVISYDVSENRLRNKIAKTLENYGHRVQYSVFECDISKGMYKKLYEELAVMIAGKEDVSIRVYSLCGNCTEKVCVLGEQTNYDVDRDDVLII